MSKSLGNGNGNGLENGIAKFAAAIGCFPDPFLV